MNEYVVLILGILGEVCHYELLSGCPIRSRSDYRIKFAIIIANAILAIILSLIMFMKYFPKAISSDMYSGFYAVCILALIMDAFLIQKYRNTPIPSNGREPLKH